MARPADVARHVIVQGRVQGVGYRIWSSGMASIADVKGGCATVVTARWRLSLSGPPPVGDARRGAAGEVRRAPAVVDVVEREREAEAAATGCAGQRTIFR